MKKYLDKFIADCKQALGMFRRSWVKVVIIGVLWMIMFVLVSFLGLLEAWKNFALGIRFPFDLDKMSVKISRERGYK